MGRSRFSIGDEDHKLIRNGVLGVLGLIVVLGLSSVLVASALDQNFLKNQFIRWVHHQTGKQLTIAGEVSWSVFPLLGAQLRQVMLTDNAAPGAATYLVRAKEVELAVKFLPLLRGAVEIERIILNEPEVIALKNSVQKSSWQDFFASPGAPSSIDDLEGFYRQKIPVNFGINHLVVRNGRFTWQQGARQWVLSQGSIVWKGLKNDARRPASLEGSGNLRELSAGIKGKFKFSVQDLRLQNQVWQATGFRFTGKLRNRKVGRHTVVLKSSGDFQVDRAAQITGKIQLNVPDFSKILILGGEKSILPGTCSLEAELNLAPQAITVNDLAVQLGDLQLGGKLSYAKGRWGFDLELNQLNLDRMPLGDSDSARPSHSAQTSSEVASPSKSVEFGWREVLAKLKLQGQLKLAKLQYRQWLADNLQLRLVVDQGQVVLAPVTADFYQGKLQAQGTLDLMPELPSYAGQLTLEGAQLQPLLMAGMEYNRIQGGLDARLSLKLRGELTQHWQDQLMGDGEIVVTKGSYQGIDLPAEVRRVHALLNQKPVVAATQPPHTDFDSLTARFTIAHGLLTSQELLMRAPDYQVVGQGSANLRRQQLHFSLNATSNWDDSFQIPVQITGKFDDPKIRVDAAVMLRRAVQKSARKLIKEQLQKHALPKQLQNILPLGRILR